MAEIYAVKEVWDPKVQLCWWHLRKAVRERLKNTKLSTAPYKPAQANAEFPFINIAFMPLGKADAIETEGLIDSEELASSARSSPMGPSLPRQFCHPDLREAVIELIEKHFCAHPLIPGYSAPDPFQSVAGLSNKSMNSVGITIYGNYGRTFGKTGIEWTDGGCGRVVHTLRYRG